MENVVASMLVSVNNCAVASTSIPMSLCAYHCWLELTTTIVGILKPPVSVNLYAASLLDPPYGTLKISTEIRRLYQRNEPGSSAWYYIHLHSLTFPCVSSKTPTCVTSTIAFTSTAADILPYDQAGHPALQLESSSSPRSVYR